MPFAYILIVAVLIACTSIQAMANNQVTVEAEGVGVKKMDALQDAWMNAVRQAVGIYVHGKSVLTDDKVTEQIVNLSRGKMNSYQILAESMEADGSWKLRISAVVDNDIIQEAIPAGQQSMSLTIDDNFVASSVTDENKKVSQKELSETLKPLLDMKDCLDYYVQLVRGENKDDYNCIYAIHTLKYNLDKYLVRITEISKLLDEIAISKKKVFYRNMDFVNKAVAEIEMRSPLPDWGNSDRRRSNVATAFDVDSSDSNTTLNLAFPHHVIQYTLDRDLGINKFLESIKYRLYLIIESGNSFGSFAQKKVFDDFTLNRKNMLVPIISCGDEKGTSSLSVLASKLETVLQIRCKLNIPNDQLVKMQESGTKLNGRYELELVE